MEFEEMKKVWDTQNQRPLYAIDEETLFRRVTMKKRKSARQANINEWGLILINVVVCAVVISKIITHTSTFYQVMIPVILILITGYILFLRYRRKKNAERFDRTLLGDLDHAIANLGYLERLSRSMVWWYILPLGVPAILNIFFFEDHDKLYWKLTLIISCLALSFLVTRWESRKLHLPRKRELQQLRDMLLNSH